ncbi:hypothetical protein KDW_49460 [Dictyobacter vulcani]|uniref:HTH-like domain-containing protein n=1 Tax=Dictyobacter vulcani TaxID=2607529 RepID=A0A5J4KN79_9CHLR|nr:IS3 family transposase [Dictyobacter vulcani]GER90784.1 hypothetical protein KDW_49460 [Dictyobacter vulcani]
MLYQCIAEAQADEPVTRLCATLGVSVSAYYAWRRRRERQHQRKGGELKQAIEDVYAASWQSYGSPRILVELQAQGYRCSSRKRVARLLREQGLCARSRRVRTTTTRQAPPPRKQRIF